MNQLFIFGWPNEWLSPVRSFMDCEVYQEILCRRNEVLDNQFVFFFRYLLRGEKMKWNMAAFFLKYLVCVFVWLIALYWNGCEQIIIITFWDYDEVWSACSKITNMLL